jgi:hypothetical protein
MPVKSVVWSPPQWQAGKSFDLPCPMDLTTDGMAEAIGLLVNEPKSLRVHPSQYDTAIRVLMQYQWPSLDVLLEASLGRYEWYVESDTERAGSKGLE